MDIKKKEAEKFPLGSTQVVTVLRASGAHGDMTGAGAPGVFKQVGVGQSGASLYRSVMAAAHSEDTCEALPFPATPQVVWNTITGNMGAAATAAGGDAVYNKNGSVYDFSRIDTGLKPNSGTISWMREVPTKKQIKFVPEPVRATQQFVSIHAFVEAVENQAVFYAMVFGPA